MRVVDDLDPSLIHVYGRRLIPPPGCSNAVQENINKVGAQHLIRHLKRASLLTLSLWLM